VNTAGKDEKIPSVGDVVKINGKELKISKVLSKNEYSKWLEINNISKLDENSYFAGEEDKIETSKYFEYLDYYYSELDRYLEENLLFYANDKKVWLAVEKDVEEAKYAFISNDYYKAYKYKELYGRYPSRAELREAYNSLPYWDDVLDEKYSNYVNEYYQSVSFGYLLQNKAYFVSESDYVEISKRAGETHPTALRSVYYNYNFDDYNYHEDIYDIYGEAAEMDIIGRYEGYTTSYAQGFTYVLIHSKNPEVTQKWIEENASDIEIKGDLDPIVTPKDLFNKLIERNKEDIISSLVSMAVLLILLSVCMYFIMRSSLMARIKEVGIYRAIGVSKKNIIYKFAVEAFVVASLTVLLGYLFSSGFIAFCMWISPMIKGVFFYPWWMALGVLTFLYALSIFCGTIPVMSLLRKTPSEILAKYDI
jgi:ABC-type antimicrobial peptide transport system permease subunit